jgi:hypothetical protein
MKEADIFIVLKPVIEIFEKLSIPYYIGGSVASSIYGIARTTMDVDVVADIKVHHIPLLKKTLEESYYIDEGMIKEAIRNKTSFNLIHFETAVKIDVFIFKDIPFHRKALERRKKDTLGENVKTKFYFSSPEDIIISKLQWYELGGKISERQWLDVVGVVKVQHDSLDKNYLKMWSKKLGIYDLLMNAFEEAGVKSD